MVQKVVCLDDGHNSYGKDTGAEGNGLLEQDLTLYICRKLRALLEFNGFKVVLTRDGDLVTGLSNGYSLNQSLQARCDISNNAKADIFISCHINAGGGTGQEILIYGTGGRAEVLANKLLPYLVNAGQWANRGIKVVHDYVTGPNTNAPAILTENGFIDTVSDANKLKSNAFLDGIAVAHAKGICDYFGVVYKDSNTSTIQTTNNNQGVNNDMLEVAILKYSSEDEWSAKDIDAKFGGVANFTRQGTDRKIPTTCLNSKLLIIIGGPDIPSHSNRVYLSGNTKYDTSNLVSTYLKGK